MQTAPQPASVSLRASLRSQPSGHSGPAEAAGPSAERNPSRHGSHEVWARYRDNAARHLIGIARDFQNRAMHRLTGDRRYRDLRPSLGPLFSLIAIEARPLGALASQLAISPQACSQLVNVGESAGYLERVLDPEDRRSRLVVLTKHGRALVEDAVGTLRAVESEYRALIGAEAYSRLTRALGELFHGLGIPTHSNVDLSLSSTRSIGVLPLISVRVQQDLMKATAARGHAGLKMSHAQVLPLIGPEGARVNELARIQRVSRQAISTTARDLERLGYLRREADPRDRRGIVFRLTTQGTRLIEASVEALDEQAETFRAVLGARRLRGLESAARQLYQALHLEEEVFEARITPALPGEAASESGPELQRLAASLRRQLGARDAGRLAALLETRI